MDQSPDYTLRAELEQPFISSDTKNIPERKEKMFSYVTEKHEVKDEH